MTLHRYSKRYLDIYLNIGLNDIGVSNQRISDKKKRSLITFACTFTFLDSVQFS